MAYRRVARRKARKYGLDPKVFERQIQQESGFQPHIGSPAGAQGIAQIMPATARGWGVDPDKPREALDAAAKNMASYVKRYGGYENALRAYNAGPGAIQASKGYAETNNYVKTILGGKDPGKLDKPSRDNGGGGGGRPRGRTGARTRVTTTNTPGVSNKAARGQLIASFLEDREADPVDFALGIKALKDVPGSSTTTRKRTPGTTVPRRRDGGGGGGGGGGGRPGQAPAPHGGYQGTEGAIKQLSRLADGLTVTSAKRNNTNPYSGSRSDHDNGNQDAFAYDMSNGSSPTPQMDAYAARVARTLGISYKKGTPINKTATKNGIRYQLIYRGTGPAFGGNHMNHVHLGAKRVGRGGPTQGVLR